MIITEHDCDAGGVSEMKARAELERVLTDTRLRATERHRAILQYLADLYFSGGDKSVKAYSIAIDVLGRTCGFEPSLDPIVRIEMSRLRAALDAYYGAYGHESSIWLEVPKGRYTVNFIPAPIQTAHADSVACDQEPPVVPSKKSAVQRTKHLAFIPGSIAVGGVLLAILGASTLNFASSHRAYDRPAVTVKVETDSPGMDAQSEAFRDNIQAAMLRFATVAIAVEEDSDTEDSNYQIKIKYGANGGTRNVQWSIVDRLGHRILDAGVEQLAQRGLRDEEAEKQLATLLAVRFADRGGAIATAEMNKAGPGAIGNVCILRAYKAVRTRNDAEISSAIECLDDTIAQEPRNSAASAFLSKVLSIKGDPVSVERAVHLAEQAVVYDSSSDVAQLALAKIHFSSGRLDAAIGAAKRAFANNPANPDVLASLGLFYFSQGDWDSAGEMADLAFLYKTIPPTDAILTKALDAYRMKDWNRSARLADEISSQSKIAQVLRAAALMKMVATPGAIKNLAELHLRYPDLPKEGRERIRSQLYSSDFSGAFEQGFSLALPDRTASIH